MSKKIHFQIPEPCNENWQNMTPVEQGKFCIACNKTVTDFSSMTDEEILLQISKSSGNVCGRFMPDQLNRGVNIGDAKKKMSLKYFWNMLFAGLLISSETTSQIKRLQGKVKIMSDIRPVSQPQVVMGLIATPMLIENKKLRVVDAEDNSPVPFASIELVGKQEAFAADSNGTFAVTTEVKMSDAIRISSVGYESRIISIAEVNGKADVFDIKLQRSQNSLGEVTVVGFGTTTCRTMTGGILAVRTVTTIDKIKDTVSTLFNRNPIRLFPNPVAKGGVFHMQFVSIKSGVYRLELINSAGQIVRQETITILTKNQVKQFFIENSYASGVYFVRVRGEMDKEVYQSKFIIR